MICSWSRFSQIIAGTRSLETKDYFKSLIRGFDICTFPSKEYFFTVMTGGSTCVTFKVTRASDFFMTTNAKTRERGKLIISLPGRGKTKLGLVGDWGTMYVNSEYLSLIFSSPALRPFSPPCPFLFPLLQCLASSEFRDVCRAVCLSCYLIASRQFIPPVPSILLSTAPVCSGPRLDDNHLENPSRIHSGPVHI